MSSTTFAYAANLKNARPSPWAKRNLETLTSRQLQRHSTTTTPAGASVPRTEQSYDFEPSGQSPSPPTEAYPAKIEDTGTNSIRRIARFWSNERFKNARNPRHPLSQDNTLGSDKRGAQLNLNRTQAFETQQKRLAAGGEVPYEDPSKVASEPQGIGVDSSHLVNFTDYQSKPRVQGMSATLTPKWSQMRVREMKGGPAAAGFLRSTVAPQAPQQLVGQASLESALAENPQTWRDKAVGTLWDTDVGAYVYPQAAPGDVRRQRELAETHRLWLQHYGEWQVQEQATTRANARAMRRSFVADGSNFTTREAQALTKANMRPLRYTTHRPSNTPLTTSLGPGTSQAEYAYDVDAVRAMSLMAGEQAAYNGGSSTDDFTVSGLPTEEQSIGRYRPGVGGVVDNMPTLAAAEPLLAPGARTVDTETLRSPADAAAASAALIAHPTHDVRTLDDQIYSGSNASKLFS